VPQSGGEEQEDACPQHGHVLEEGVQPRLVDGRRPQPDHLGGQPGGERGMPARRAGEQEAQAEIGEREVDEEDQ
jgi:hypothetical protein